MRRMRLEVDWVNQTTRVVPCCAKGWAPLDTSTALIEDGRLISAPCPVCGEERSLRVGASVARRGVAQDEAPPKRSLPNRSWFEF